jgi:hypothetical protein
MHINQGKDTYLLIQIKSTPPRRGCRAGAGAGGGASFQARNRHIGEVLGSLLPTLATANSRYWVGYGFAKMEKE